MRRSPAHKSLGGCLFCGRRGLAHGPLCKRRALILGGPLNPIANESRELEREMKAREGGVEPAAADGAAAPFSPARLSLLFWALWR